MKIAIRADGGSKIGMGHIMRTLVLAKELAKANDVFYICRVDEPLSDIYSPGIIKIKKQGFHVVTIDESNILEELSNVQADILITDSYDVDENYFNETKKLFKYTGYIDDMNLYYFNVDFLINQNINAEDLNYRVNNNTKLFLGPKYAMLREEFRNVPKKIIKKKVEDILITVGGADPNNVIGKILSYVKQLDYKFHVIVGPTFNTVNELKQYEKENKNIKLYFNANMFQLMQKCDLAISACGSTLYELSSCGVPTLGVIIADNQIKIGNKFHHMGMISNLGWHEKLNKYILVSKLDEICNNRNYREEISKLTQKLISNNYSLNCEFFMSKYKHK
ncbi:UDP-2,4-diacetamido-2,4,6-trideoxy-beta-L-altropyranose hydrolase [Clostridium sp. KNHs214]|uniref:UDP-2,4-diacetamido-2,4, 6-trideoxy-beta-L-altropyranose hydrolase n=1 Tax=Clostridium sp. KNHs214 TaxID=1540257 RepID=UPI00068D7519|nr:UDP-2,4-diacetamido-2,4,6-trideoxy-beta-L-altropyranose hydrolase [Clostridium sp. KNHs214]